MPLSSQLSLAPSPRSAADARRWIRAACLKLNRPELVEAAEVGISELVANAILHGRGPITVRLRGTASHPRVEVLDGSTEPPVPPALDDVDEDDADLLTTFGRGLAMVARSATAWGASIDENGKIVWFEPSPELREDGDIEWVIDQDVTDGPENPGEAATLVALLGFDLRLYEALNRQYRELRRELRLLSLAHQADYPLASDLSGMFDDFERQFPRTYHDQIFRALEQRRASTDLEVPIQPAASSLFVTMGEMFDLADAFCRAERLLAMERTPRQREFHSWLLGEFVRQIAGEEPRRWPGVATARSASNVS